MNEVDLLFALLRNGLTGSTIELPKMEARGWWNLFRLAQQNHVTALTAVAMAQQEVPREVKIPWLAEQEKSIQWHHYQVAVQNDITSLMERHGIRTLVLKGTSTARHYPQAELREFGDLDLYFYDRHAEADEVARKELRVSISDDAHHHTKYDYRGVSVESHYDLLNIHYPPSNQRYEQMLIERLERPEFEVLFLLRHMAVHFASSRITLRDLVDWVLTCRALSGQADWQEVEQQVEAFGMTAFASALGTIAERRLGLSTPLPHDNSPEQTSDIERDMALGNPWTLGHTKEDLGRMGWKIGRWRAMGWKRQLVFDDSPLRLLAASITSHAEKPRSILHKM